MGLADWFSEFCGNLVVDNQQIITQRYRRITRRLNLSFRTYDSETAYSRYLGSYGRNTKIRHASDIDMKYQLPDALYNKYHYYSTNGQSALLQAVRNAIQIAYPSTSISGDGQVVCVNFGDGVKFEVLPVFLGNNGVLIYPDSNNGGSWKTTNPIAEINAFRSRNDDCNANLIQLCRMMRAWKQMWNVPISGMLLDTLAYQFMATWEHKKKSFLYYDWMCRDFFEFLANQPLSKEYWRAPGSNQPVYKKGLFQTKAKSCHDISLRAIAYEVSNPKREALAKEEWRKIFGRAF